MKCYNIDKTYIISLPNSERLERTMVSLRLAGLHPEIFNAIRMKDGAEGLRLTMKSIFQNCLKKGFNNVLIFEDDVSVVYGFKDQAKKAIDDLPTGFHLCKFGANLLTPVTKVSENLNQIGLSYALHACLYSREGMIAILDAMKENEPIDVSIMKHVEPLGKCFVSSKMLATQLPYKSDIFKFDPNKHVNVDSFYNKETEIVDWNNLMQSAWERNTNHLNQKQ